MVKEIRVQNSKTPSLDADGTKLSGVHGNHQHYVQDRRKRQAKHLLSGGIAGAVSRTCVSPLERVKILFQIQVTNKKYVGVTSTLKTIFREEGFKGFFKGNGTNVLRIFPYTAVQFAAYEEYKKLLGIPDDPHHHTPGRRLVAGALAGMTSVTATYPLDLVRTRLAAQGEGPDRKYRNIAHAFKTIVKEEGGFLSGCLYRGWTVTVVGIAPYVGLNFAFYETLKGFVFRVLFPDRKGESTFTGMFVKEELPVLTRLACGGLAGALAQSITYPLDVVRRRFQMSGISGSLFQYTGLFHAFRYILKTEGYRGLYKGMWPNLLKVAPLVGIQFVTYEIAKAVMHGHPIPLPWR